MSSRGKRSMVWEFFSLTTDNKFVVCSLCKKQYKFFKNTTNLKEHLKRLHPSHLLVPPAKEERDPEDNDEPKPSTSTSASQETPQTSSASTSTEQPPTKKYRSKQLRLFGSSRSNTELTETQMKDFNLALIKMIVLDYQPLRIVEDRGFRELVNKLNPLYTIPSRKNLSSKLIPELYQSEVDKLQQKLLSVRHVGVTTDLWTSDSTIHYITVTIHFIENGVLHASALQTTEVKGSQTGARIAVELTEIFNKWEINEKITTIVSDNGANVKLAITEFLNKYHHPCCAHTLNLSANDCLSANNDLNTILEKCRKIVGHFKHSAIAAEKLRTMQQQMNSPKLKVKQDVSTRWNSTYAMLQRMIEIKVTLTVVMSGLQKAPDMLSADEWLAIEDCVPILVIHNTTGTRTAAFFISKRLGYYERDKLSSKATFLDPRYKKQGFGSPHNADNAEKWVIEELGSIFAEASVKPPAAISEVEDVPGSSSDVDMLWEYFDKTVADSTEVMTASPTAQSIMMVKQYLSMPNIPRSSSPLNFWIENKNLFPELFQMHEKYLCAPATSVPSERIFSKTGLLTNTRRNRLSPKNLDYIVFLNTNL